MSDHPFYADCPHCERYEFTDEDAWFEHVSMCEYDQAQDREENE